MALTRQRVEWERTAVLAVPLYEPLRDHRKRSQPFTTHDFNPYAEYVPSGRKLDSEAFQDLKRVLTGKK